MGRHPPRPYIEDGTRGPERLVVVINADDLRAEGIELSRHLSWERTADSRMKSEMALRPVLRPIQGSAPVSPGMSQPRCDAEPR